MSLWCIHCWYWRGSLWLGIDGGVGLGFEVRVGMRTTSLALVWFGISHFLGLGWVLLFGVLVYPPVFLAAVLGFRNFGLLFIFIHSLVDCFILIITFLCVPQLYATR